MRMNTTLLLSVFQKVRRRVFSPVRFIAVLTAACFLFSFIVAQPLQAVIERQREITDAQALFEGIVIPASAGRVTEASGDASNGTLVVAIQDLHCHPEVQKNISRILSILDARYHLKKVYIEGAYGPVDTSWLARIKNKDARKTVIDTLADGGTLTGAEQYSITGGRTDLLYGIDDRKVHTENIQRLGAIEDRQQVMRDQCAGMASALERLKYRYFNPKVRKLDSLVLRYKRGELEPQKFYSAVRNYAGELGIDLNGFRNVSELFRMYELTRTLDYGDIRSQMAGYLASLRQKLPYSAYQMLAERTENFTRTDQLHVYLSRIAKRYDPNLSSRWPDLQNYFDYIEANDRINPLQLVAEESRLLNEIRLRLAAGAGERDIIFLAGFEQYLKDYLSYTISPDDYAFVRANMPRFKRLCAQYLGGDTLARLGPELSLLDEYYRVNVERNEILFRNCGIAPAANAAPLKDTANDPALMLAGARDVVVVVAGGFHTVGLSELMKQKGIPYVVVTPNITQDVAPAAKTYAELLLFENKLLAAHRVPGPAVVARAVRTAPLEAMQLIVLSGLGRYDAATVVAGELVRQIGKGGISLQDANDALRDISIAEKGVIQVRETGGTYVLSEEYVDDKGVTVRIRREFAKDDDNRFLGMQVTRLKLKDFGETVAFHRRLIEKARKDFVALNRANEKQKIDPEGAKWFDGWHRFFDQELRGVANELKSLGADNADVKRAVQMDARPGSRVQLFADRMCRELFLKPITADNPACTVERLLKYLRAENAKEDLSFHELRVLQALLRFRLVSEVSSRNAGELNALSNEGAKNLFIPVVEGLKTLHAADWGAIVLKVSNPDLPPQLEEEGVFGLMDARTRIAYLQAVSEIASRTGKTEDEVIRRAMERTANTRARLSERERSSHIGYYLVAEGKSEFIRSLGGKESPGERFLRMFSPSFIYLSLQVVFTALLTGLFAYALLSVSAIPLIHPVSLVAVGAFGVAVQSTSAHAVDDILSRFTKTTLLPKMDFESGVPDDFRTALAYPVQLAAPRNVDSLFNTIETNYANNPDPNLLHVVLLALPDSQNELPTEKEQEMIDYAVKKVQELNDRLGAGKFYLLFRDRSFSEREKKFVEKERKRGKLGEFNRWLLGREQAGDTTRLLVGQPEMIKGKTRFVISLDSDSIFPKGQAVRLVETMAHPLNRAVVDRGRVRKGYGVLFTSLGVVPSHDRYTPADTEYGRMQRREAWRSPDTFNYGEPNIHQDFLGTTAWTGKGIYDPEVMENVLLGIIPDDRLRCEDYVVGFYLRAGIATDIMIYEEVSHHLLLDLVRRMGWIRGDVQNAVWILPGPLFTAREKGFAQQGNPVQVIDRWKIYDKVRRAMLPAILLTVFATTLILTNAATGGLFAALTLLFLTAMPHAAISLHWVRSLPTAIKKGVQEILMLPLDAFWNMKILWKAPYYLVKPTLQWTISAHAQLRQEMTKPRTILKRYLPIQLVLTAAAIAAVFFNVSQVPFIVFAWVLWNVVAPFVMIRLSMPSTPDWMALMPFALRVRYLFNPRTARERIEQWQEQRLARRPLSPDSSAYLAALARDTWNFFADYVNEKNHYLPPDHVQMLREGGEPDVYTPTSPTNIGYYLLSVAVAEKAGTIDRAEAVERIADTVRTVASLETWNGLFYDRYDTVTLEGNRQVSTVECGNLAACLISIGRLYPEVQEGARRIVDAMDFTHLYDEDAGLLYMGYDADKQEMDPHHYDMLMSEIRTTYVVAIAKGQIPPDAWSTMNRGLVKTGSGWSIGSYGGGAMEYFLPTIHVNEPLLAPVWLGEALRVAVHEQMVYGRHMKFPNSVWGNTESAHSRVEDVDVYDNDGTQRYYRRFGYAPFGVPPLGTIKYADAQDEPVPVIAPYASVLAANIPGTDIDEVVRNLRALEKLGVRDPRYGFFDAVDVSRPEKSRIARQVFPHHQGFIMAALGNILFDGMFQESFSGDEAVKKILPVIKDMTPPAPALKAVREKALEGKRYATRTHCFGNRKLGVRFSGTGVSRSTVMGWLAAFDPAFTEAVNGNSRQFISITDTKSKQTIPAGFTSDRAPPDDISFLPGSAEITRTEQGLSVRTRVWVDENDPVNIEEIALDNRSDRETRDVIVASHLGWALKEQLESRTGTGIITRYDPETGAVFVRGSAAGSPVAFHAIDRTAHLSDPRVSLGTRVIVRPGEKTSIRFITGFAKDEDEARRLIWKYRHPDIFEHSRQEAMQSAKKDIQKSGVDVKAFLQWSTVLSEMLATGKTAITNSITSEASLPDALNLIRSRALWAKYGIPVKVQFVLDIADRDERARVVTTLEAFANGTRVRGISRRKEGILPLVLAGDASARVPVDGIEVRNGKLVREPAEEFPELVPVPMNLFPLEKELPRITAFLHARKVVVTTARTTLKPWSSIRHLVEQRLKRAGEMAGKTYFIPRFADNADAAALEREVREAAAANLDAIGAAFISPESAQRQVWAGQFEEFTGERGLPHIVVGETPLRVWVKKLGHGAVLYVERPDTAVTPGIKADVVRQLAGLLCDTVVRGQSFGKQLAEFGSLSAADKEGELSLDIVNIGADESLLSDENMRLFGTGKTVVLADRTNTALAAHTGVDCTFDPSLPVTAQMAGIASAYTTKSLTSVALKRVSLILSLNFKEEREKAHTILNFENLAAHVAKIKNGAFSEWSVMNTLRLDDVYRSDNLLDTGYIDGSPFKAGIDKEFAKNKDTTEKERDTFFSGLSPSEKNLLRAEAYTAALGREPEGDDWEILAGELQPKEKKAFDGCLDLMLFKQVVARRQLTAAVAAIKGQVRVSRMFTAGDARQLQNLRQNILASLRTFDEAYVDMRALAGATDEEFSAWLEGLRADVQSRYPDARVFVDLPAHLAALASAAERGRNIIINPLPVRDLGELEKVNRQGNVDYVVFSSVFAKVEAASSGLAEVQIGERIRGLLASAGLASGDRFAYGYDIGRTIFDTRKQEVARESRKIPDDIFAKLCEVALWCTQERSNTGPLVYIEKMLADGVFDAGETGELTRAQRDLERAIERYRAGNAGELLRVYGEFRGIMEALARERSGLSGPSRVRFPRSEDDSDFALLMMLAATSSDERVRNIPRLMAEGRYTDGRLSDRLRDCTGGQLMAMRPPSIAGLDLLDLSRNGTVKAAGTQYDALTVEDLIQILLLYKQERSFKAAVAEELKPAINLGAQEAMNAAG